MGKTAAVKRRKVKEPVQIELPLDLNSEIKTEVKLDLNRRSKPAVPRQARNLKVAALKPRELTTEPLKALRLSVESMKTQQKTESTKLQAVESIPESIEVLEKTVEKTTESKVAPTQIAKASKKGRSWVHLTISGLSKSGAFLLPGVFIFNAMLYSAPVHAATTRCEKSQPVKGCVGSFKDLDKEQARLDQFDKNISLKKEALNVFQPVNGKMLYMNFLGRHSLKIQFNNSKVDVVYNGKPADDIRVCYEACPQEARVTWYTDKYGEFKKINNGLSVGSYEFKIDNAK